MQINENTKVMARLHREANNRGLSIYNPYFEQAGVNALYVLFHNEDPKPLLDGLKNLNISGAIPAGFEKSPDLPEMMDQLGPVAKKIQRVALIVQRDGKLIGYNQGGYGLLDAILSKAEVRGKKIVLMGAGNVANGLLTVMGERGISPSGVEVYNRTVENAETLAESYDVVKKVGSLEDMRHASGDIFVNVTYIGSPWRQGDDFQFTEEFVKRFGFVADVTFVPLEPQLIKIAKKAGIPNSPGWEMFLYQGRMCLEKTLDIEVDLELLGKLIVKDFATNWS